MLTTSYSQYGKISFERTAVALSGRLLLEMDGNLFRRTVFGGQNRNLQIEALSTAAFYRLLQRASARSGGTGHK